MTSGAQHRKRKRARSARRSDVRLAKLKRRENPVTFQPTCPNCGKDMLPRHDIDGRRIFLCSKFGECMGIREVGDRGPHRDRALPVDGDSKQMAQWLTHTARWGRKGATGRYSHRRNKGMGYVSGRTGWGNAYALLGTNIRDARNNRSSPRRTDLEQQAR